jgi:protoheme IX farnesyltransferase
VNSEHIKAYYQLAKPGIVYGNLLTAAAGLLFASQENVNGWLLAGLLIGIGLVIGSACVLNNIIDRGIDKKMARTKKRALVTGEISLGAAYGYGIVLGLIGFTTLALFTNWLTVALGAIAMILYVIAYGIAKRKSVHGTLVGAIPGAIPLAAGYVAVTNSFDGAAWLLLLVLMVWQMPHFYSIAIYRRKEYAAANVPILSVKSGVDATKKQIFGYIILFIIATLLLTYFRYTGTIFAVAMIVIGFVWLFKAKQGFKVKDSDKWARGMFGFSLKVLLLLCLLLSVDAWLA